MKHESALKMRKTQNVRLFDVNSHRICRHSMHLVEFNDNEIFLPTFIHALRLFFGKI
jgi:hypothetical protein